MKMIVDRLSDGVLLCPSCLLTWEAATIEASERRDGDELSFEGALEITCSTCFDEWLQATSGVSLEFLHMAAKDTAKTIDGAGAPRPA
ncbi:MAG: hypothetical protein IPL61_23030 [Myxococcales bacterium]|nr:hypothetical protein [Myxococcales bacterium]